MIPMIDLKDGINRERKSVRVKRAFALVFLFSSMCLCGAGLGVLVASVDNVWFSGLVVVIAAGMALTARYLL